jgi:hypothetical protein
MRLVDTAKQIYRERSIFNRTGRAFRSVFNPRGNLIEDQKIVLKALHTFCRVGVTDHGSNDTQIARAVGRREVWNWIVGHTNYEPFELETLMSQIREIEDE